MRRFESKRAVSRAGTAQLAHVALGLLAFGASACAPAFEKYDQQHSVRGTFGEEVYKVLCRRVAGTEMPQDLSGQQSQQICLGDAPTVQQAADAGRMTLPPRVIALADQRALLVQAMDDMLPEGMPDQFEHLMRDLLPLYDPPDEQLEFATRELAHFLQQVEADPSALAGAVRILRDGMTPHEGTLGLLRSGFAGSHLRDMALSVLGPIVAPAPTDNDPTLGANYDTLLTGLALELATSELDDKAKTDAARAKRLLTRTNPDFASGQPVYVAKRDARGLPVPLRAASDPLPYPFVDTDGDGLPDASGPVLLTAPDFGKPAPEPFPGLGEGPVARDAAGRAQALAPGGASDPSRLLYDIADADQTLLAGLLRVVGKLFQNDKILGQLGTVLSAIAGDHAPTNKAYGNYPFAYNAPNQAASPLLDLIHGSTALVDQPVSDDSMVLTKSLIQDQEPALVESIVPLLAIERNTRPDHDEYPNAKLKRNHTFWDELLTEAEKLTRQRITKDGSTLLEEMLRASLGYGRNLQKPGAPIEQIVDPDVLAHQGDIIATMARFKDEWRANPKGESKRMAGEPELIGSFHTPVDRTKADTPVTCGKDGCGGPIAGTPFARWQQPGQNCMWQRPRRSSTGVDCGAPSNQSLLQRSLGLIAEMAGRSQCNKAVSVRDLLTFAQGDPCIKNNLDPNSAECATAQRMQDQQRDQDTASAEQAVRTDYTCPADQPDAPCHAYADRYPSAFIDPDGPDGPAPSSIQACHLLDLPDVGRAYGKVIIHEFQFDFPNPWVRRYLEDVARAGDHVDPSLVLPPCAADFKIVDPTVAPNCTPEAARLSRDLYTHDPVDAERIRQVDNLGELMEFLLDTTKLFKDDADTLALRPDAKELTRVLFAAAGDSTSTFAVFDPLLLRNAPPACDARPDLQACPDDDTMIANDANCCIKDTVNPPFRFRIDTYYGATSFAWEQPIRLTDGKTISFLDAMVSLSDAVDRYDYDQTRGDDPKNFEDTSDAVSQISKVLAEHYDSDQNTYVQTTNPNGMNYRHQTGIVSYEALIADAFDDGMIDLTQPGPYDNVSLYDANTMYAKDRPTPDQQLGVLYHSLPLLKALPGLSIAGAGDGIHVSADMAEQLINPHAHCAGESGDRRVLNGLGACDYAVQNQPGFVAPFTYRDGRGYICWSDGTCFPGPTPPRRYPSPLYVMIDAIGAMQRKVIDDPVRKPAMRGVLSGFLDTFLGTANGRFSDRRARALLLGMVDDERDRWAEERAAGTLATLGMRTDQDGADLLHNPVVAGALGLLESLSSRGTALADLSHFIASSLSEDPAQNNLRPLLAGLFDMVQLAPGDNDTNAAMRSIGTMFASDVNAAVRGDPGIVLAPRSSMVGRNVFILEKTAEADSPDSVFEHVMQNLGRAPPGRASPLEAIYDVAIEIDRAVPGAVGTPSADDLGRAIHNVAQVMLDNRRGFERLYQLVICTRHPDDKANGCD